MRYYAASVLGNIGKGEPKVIEALLPLLRDDDSDVRSRAASALGNIRKGETKIVASIENWIEQHQNTSYVGNGIDVLWNLVADES